MICIGLAFLALVAYVVGFIVVRDSHRHAPVMMSMMGINWEPCTYFGWKSRSDRVLYDLYLPMLHLDRRLSGMKFVLWGPPMDLNGQICWDWSEYKDSQP
jgi:hypothetical protein